MRKTWVGVLAVVGFAGWAQPVCGAEKLPPISAADRELKEAPGEPSAPAVFLIKRGTIHLRNLAFQEPSSLIRVQARLKILKEEGKSQGEVTIAHGRSVRLTSFNGRTISPDGKVVKVDSKGKFKQKISETTKREVSAIAFPDVQVGSILEYEYELAFNSFYLLEPWYFMDEIPVLQSEVVWEVPTQLASRVWTMPTFATKVTSEQKGRAGYTEARYSASNLPSTPHEVYGPPFRDLAARMMVIPLAYRDSDVNLPLLESWAAVCEGMDEYYVKARKQAIQVTAKAVSLAAGKPQEEAAAVLNRFVRDEIKNTEEGDGPWIGEDVTVDKVLSKGEGSTAEKALLLQSLLAAVNINAQLVWAADRRDGKVLADLPNPGAFDRVLVRTSFDNGQKLFFDPVDPSLASGRISAPYEGTVALIHDPKNPESVTLPVTSFAAHQKQARLDLAIDADGRASGHGELLLRGHYAWEESFPRREAKETQEAWQKWADRSMPGYKITDIKVDDRPDESALKVTWAMAATEESVLGDEVTLTPARPLGPLKQPFVLTEAERRSPVVMTSGGIEDVEWKITWPEGWSVAAPFAPSIKDVVIAAHRMEIKVDPATRTAVAKRHLEIRKREPADRTEFAALRNLFGEAEKRDAQTVVIARH